MTTVYLSWFEDIYNKVYNALQGGLFKWVSGWFSEGMNWLSEKWNGVISSALQKVANTILNSLLEIIFARFYAFLTTVLLVLDCIEDCFDIVSGISPVYRLVNGTYKPMSLLSAVYMEESIQKMIAVMIGVGMALCMLTTILATVKSMLEMDGRETKPVSHVMRQTAKAMLYFILVPVMASFMILLSGAILNTIDDAFTGGKGKTTVARTIFTIASLDAVDTEKHPGAEIYNSSYEGEKASDFGVLDKYRSKFFTVGKGETLPEYAHPVHVKEIFTFRGFDYVIGIGMGIYFNIVLGMVLFIFICRIFEVIVLIITEPFFIAMMPLDDGEHFKSWSNLFLGKLFGGYGMVVAMRLYLMVGTMLFENKISFVRPDSSGATVQNYLIKLLFLAGGAMGIRSMGPLVTNILSQEAARTEQEQAAIGARFGGSIARFQGKRLGKLLMGYGSLAGGLASGGAAALLSGGRTAAGAIGTKVKQAFTGGSSKSSDDKAGAKANQYNGGTPLPGPAPGAAGSVTRTGSNIARVRELATEGTAAPGNAVNTNTTVNAAAANAGSAGSAAGGPGDRAIGNITRGAGDNAVDSALTGGAAMTGGGGRFESSGAPSSTGPGSAPVAGNSGGKRVNTRGLRTRVRDMSSVLGVEDGDILDRSRRGNKKPGDGGQGFDGKR